MFNVLNDKLDGIAGSQQVYKRVQSYSEVCCLHVHYTYSVNCVPSCENNTRFVVLVWEQNNAGGKSFDSRRKFIKTSENDLPVAS